MFKKSLPALLLAVLYVILFREFELGVNVLLFDLALTATLFAERPDRFANPYFRMSLCGLYLSALSVVIVHSNWAIFAHHLSFILAIGYAQARELRFVWFALLLGLRGVLAGPFRWVGNWRVLRAGERPRGRSARLWHWTRQTVLPSLVVLPFLYIYLVGNLHFASFVEVLGDRFWKLGDRLNGADFLLFVVGLLLVLPWFLRARRVNWWVRVQSIFRDELTRRHVYEAIPGPPLQLFGSPIVRSDTGRKPRQFTTMALRGEYQRALLTFGALNALLAVVNLIDLRFLWFNPTTVSAATLSQYVHSGTYSLLFSCFLAMVVVAWYFRGNLNFLSTNRPLRLLAKAWIAQNAVLVLSVGLRNVHYIQEYGLAAGRILVAIGLILTLFGLWTLWRKTVRHSTLTYLLQVNGLALWVAVLVLGAANWSGLITRYNLAVQEPDRIDWSYLDGGLDRSNRFLLIGQRGSRFEQAAAVPTANLNTSWGGWNYADQRVRWAVGE